MKHNGIDSGVNPDGNGLPHKLQAITVTPGESLIELDLNSSGAQSFVAQGNYLDGIPEDLTSQVTWASSNAMIGSMTGAALSIPGFATATAQTTKISAKLDGFEGDAQLTVAAYRKSGPTQDFFFVLPYIDPVGVVAKPLDFSTTVPALDVYFLMDTTGSMGGEITNLKSALSGTVIPGIQAAAASTQFGVGSFQDWPVTENNHGYGAISCFVTGSPDQPFRPITAITASVPAVQAGVATLSNASGSPMGCGGDGPESGMEAIYQVVKHTGLSGPSPTSVPATPVGFRAAAMPVIVEITDAQMHAKNEADTCTVTGYGPLVNAVAHTRAETKTALTDTCSRVVGISPTTGTCSGQADLEDFATASGALVTPEAWDFGTRPAGCAAGQCCTGQNGVGRPPVNGLCPAVFLAATDGTGVSSAIVTGIQMVARFATFDVNTETDGVTTDVDGTPLGAGQTTANFIKGIVPDHFVKAPAPPVLPDPTFDQTSFHKVTPGTKVFFNVRAFNDFVLETNSAQIFRATIKVLAGGCTALDQRDVLILVPPKPLVIQ